MVGQEEPIKQVALLVYGISLCLAFLSSVLLHGAQVSTPKQMILNRLDHVAIFCLIAGTQMPIIVTFFDDFWKWVILAVVWGATFAGSYIKLIKRHIHGGWNTFIYLLLGWVSILPATILSNLFTVVPFNALLLLLLGGLFYTTGFPIYYWQKPDPFPNIFGHHEIWHLFVLAGSASHFLFIWLVVIPYPNLGFWY